MRKSWRWVFAIGALLASADASAVSCRSGFSGGAIRIGCAEPGTAESICEWTAEVTTEPGLGGVYMGTFTVPKNAKARLMVNESRFDGKRIVSAKIDVVGCTIGRSRS